MAESDRGAIIRHGMRVKSALEFALIFSADLLALTLVFVLSSHIREYVLPNILRAYTIEYTQGHLADIWWMFLIWIFFLLYEGLYAKVLSFWDEVKAFWKASFYSVVTIFTLVSIGKLSHEVSRTVILLMGGLSLFILPAARFVCKAVLRKTGLLRRNVLIMGSGETGVMVLRALRAEPNFGYRVLGFIDDKAERQGGLIEGLKVHPGIGKIERYIRACRVQDVFIAVPEENWEGLKQMINDLQYLVQRIFWIPGISGIAVLGTRLQHFFHEQVMALEFRNNLDEPLNIAIKRGSDILLGLLMLPILLPVLFVLALAIRVESRGPAIFSHERVGRNRKPFKCLKFRTMYRDSDKILKEILETDYQARREWEEHRKIRNDRRVTRVGRFLRRTSLDELPQIINVLLGQMSLVGPRPVTAEELESNYGRKAELYCKVLPGITGLWQVSGRSGTTYDYRVALDQWYVRNWNPWIDLIILIKTIRVVFAREGAW